MKRQTRRLTAETKRSLAGFSFILPWVLGFFGLYLLPLVRSLIYSFQDLGSFNDDGSLTPMFVGLANYRKAFLVDPDFVTSLTGSLKNLLTDIPSILIFSLLVAMILNQKFRGRMLARAVFFLPVIIASGIVIDILNGDMISAMMKSGEKSSGSMFQVSMFQNTLLEAGLSQDIVDFIANSANNVFELSWRSGVQILLFLAGLQAIPPSLYEAADIDGASRWQKLRYVTVPLLSPVIFFVTITSTLNALKVFDVIYTLSGSGGTDERFMRYYRTMVYGIYEKGFQFSRIGAASAEAVVLLAIILVITLIQFKGEKKWVHY